MGINLLIVDDSDIIRRMIERTVRLADLEVDAIHHAANGKQALHSLAENWIDLVLGDINMPVMDGLEMLARMRSDPQTAGVPVVVVSTEGSSERVAALMDDGVSAWIRKPFTPEQIRDVVAGLMARMPEPPEFTDVDDAVGLVAERLAFAMPEVAGASGLAEPEGRLMLAHVDFSGAATGRLSLAAPEILCSELAESMLGEPTAADAGRERAGDALAEFANVTCGQIATRLDPDRPVDLMPPVVTTMTHDEWRVMAAQPSARPYLIDDRPMLLHLALRGAGPGVPAA